MTRDLLIILSVIAFFAITKCICYLIDNKLFLLFFENSHYVFSTGNGLKGLIIVKASIGKNTTCNITITNTYTKSVKYHWTLKRKCKKIFIVWIPSQYLEFDVNSDHAKDFVVECISFNRK